MTMHGVSYSQNPKFEARFSNSIPIIAGIAADTIYNSALIGACPDAFLSGSFILPNESKAASATRNLLNERLRLGGFDPWLQYIRLSYFIPITLFGAPISVQKASRTLFALSVKSAKNISVALISTHLISLCCDGDSRPLAIVLFF